MQERKRAFSKRNRVEAKLRKNGVPRINCPECGSGTRIASAGEVYKGKIHSISENC